MSATFLIVALLSGTLAADSSPAEERLRPAGIDGTLLLCGNQPSTAVFERFVDLAGKDQAKVVLLTVAGSGLDPNGGLPARLETALQNRKAGHPVARVLLRQGELKDQDGEALHQATGVWIDGAGSLDQLLTALQSPRLEKGLRGVLQRGGVVAGQGSASACLCRKLVKGAGTSRQIVPGLDLLPGVLCDSTSARNGKPPLPEALQDCPEMVGLRRLGNTAALQVRGRDLLVLGGGNATFYLARSPAREARTIVVKPGSVQDLTLLRRCAEGRSGKPYPPAELPVPEVAGGTLVIVGGGGIPAEAARKFVELAGGPDALIVVLPTAQPDPVPLTEGAFLKRAGAKNVIVLPGRDLKAVDDPSNLELLRKAGGLWFGGGRQWRFVDAYEATKAHQLFREVLKRGGVIGGSSAGASIQGDYLCRGSPFGNLEMMCEGYERGLGFLPGVAIDQHFSQRNRLPDMTALMKTYPQFLGIGIDETTALIVHGSIGEVVGQGEVHFYDRKKPVEKDRPDHESVKAGGRYDLKQRKVLAPQKERGEP